MSTWKYVSVSIFVIITSSICINNHTPVSRIYYSKDNEKVPCSYQFNSLHLFLNYAKIFWLPDMCETSADQRETAERKVHNLALAEYFSFPKSVYSINTESVYTWGLCLECWIYGPKWFNAAPIATPSSSHGSHLRWKLGSLELKNPP